MTTCSTKYTGYNHPTAIEVVLACACYQQVRHEFKNYPFGDDTLTKFMREKFITSLRLVVLNTPTTHVGALVQQI
jgi:hypothetical protein